MIAQPSNGEFTMVRDRLVATGVPEVNAYLRVGRALLTSQAGEETAYNEWQEAIARDERLNGDYGSAEARQRAEKNYDEHRHALTTARTFEDNAKEAAEQVAEEARGKDAQRTHYAALALTEGELIAIWGDYYGLRDSRS